MNIMNALQIGIAGVGVKLGQQYRRGVRFEANGRTDGPPGRPARAHVAPGPAAPAQPFRFFALRIVSAANEALV